MSEQVTSKKVAAINKKIEHALARARSWNDLAGRLIVEREAMKPKDDAAKMAARAVEYLCSPEGQESIRRAAADSAEFIEALKKSRHIPWEKLHEPFTI